MQHLVTSVAVFIVMFILSMIIYNKFFKARFG